jgi:hypothetical protein
MYDGIFVVSSRKLEQSENLTRSMSIYTVMVMSPRAIQPS